MFKERIKERKKNRAEIASHTSNPAEATFLLISEILDDYIEHRIQADKVLEGILKDIQGNIAVMSDFDRVVEKMKIFFEENIEK